RPITLIVPAPPGGGTDVFARRLAELAEAGLRQKVVVENKAGGGGTIGTALISAAKPDGHTLGFVWNSPLTTSPHTLPVGYTPDSYAPLLSIGYSSYVLCAQPDFPAANAQEMVAHIKANPGKFTYGNDGVGGTMQLAAERIFRKLELKVRPVPFGGAGETAKNFLGGHVTFYGGSLPPILPHAKAGAAKCLMLTSAEGNEALPRASGLSSLGIGAEETVLWWGLIAPKGVPADRLATLAKVFTEAANDPRFKDVMAAQGAVHAVKDGAAMDKAIRNELAALGEVARAIGAEKKAN
ncbi:MAG TPA: tripartite tricarboxylate transporter substrate binding protein, partial [Azospirillaceae bacterium]|nr:tripartite tricarboxylate transporter substrate binding protein [Azospirillaceae bacterium]